MRKVRDLVTKLLRPHRTVRAARERLDDDRQEIADLTARMDKSANVIHHRVRVDNNISATVRSLLRGAR